MINGWVKAKTKGKIAEIIDQLSELTALVALNAVYFKSQWKESFLRQFTHDEPFHTSSGTTRNLPRMVQSGTYTYYENRHVQLARLPYRGNLSMYVVLPDGNDDSRRFRQELTSDLWVSWLAKAKPMLGTIQLPRFRVDYQAEVGIVLQRLGMERAFDPQRAQFEHVHTDRPPVWLNQVQHRSVVEVNEEGTEAAAATMSGLFCASAANYKPPKQFMMIVDHPFVIVIRDETTKTILFMGWIGDPQ